MSSVSMCGRRNAVEIPARVRKSVVPRVFVVRGYRFLFSSRIPPVERLRSNFEHFGSPLPHSAPGDVPPDASGFAGTPKNIVVVRSSEPGQACFEDFGLSGPGRKCHPFQR